MASGDWFRKWHRVIFPKKELKSPSEMDQESISGTNPDPESDDDIDTAYQKTFGNKPRGKTIAEEIDEDEKNR